MIVFWAIIIGLVLSLLVVIENRPSARDGTSIVFGTMFRMAIFGGLIMLVLALI